MFCWSEQARFIGKAGKACFYLTEKGNDCRCSEFIGKNTVSSPDLVATKYFVASTTFWSYANKANQAQTPAIFSPQYLHFPPII